MDIFQVKLSHFMAGRLRLRMEEIKGDEAKAEWVEATIGRVPGVTAVESNPLTGSVLISFHRRHIVSEDGARGLAEALGGLFPDLDVATLLVWLAAQAR